MNAQTPHPSIPAEALVRQARLQAALQAMEDAGTSREPACLQNLRAWIHDRSPAEPEPLMASIIDGNLAEEAVEILRSFRRHGADRARVEELGSRLSPHAVKAQQRRAALWQLDTRRALIRFTYAKENEALGFDDGDLHAIFLQVLRLEGLRLALDLGKRPRPLLSVGLPLPANAGGKAESMDVVLKQEPMEEPAALMVRLNQRLPAGLRIHGWDSLPAYASGLADLALVSRWRWEVPCDERTRTEEKAAAFMGASAWPWDRGASKSDASMDLRTLVTEMRWEEGALCFATRMGAFLAINPLKMLGAIFERDPSGITGLVRIGVDLKPDARLGQGERFEPKLKNMYEDAVLLGGGSNIVIVDEDDDEPLRLG